MAMLNNQRVHLLGLLKRMYLPVPKVAGKSPINGGGFCVNDGFATNWIPGGPGGYGFSQEEPEETLPFGAKQILEANPGLEGCGWGGKNGYNNGDFTNIPAEIQLNCTFESQHIPILSSLYIQGCPQVIFICLQPQLL